MLRCAFFLFFWWSEEGWALKKFLNVSLEIIPSKAMLKLCITKIRHKYVIHSFNKPLFHVLLVMWCEASSQARRKDMACLWFSWKEEKDITCEASYKN